MLPKRSYCIISITTQS